jgi:hypothetical protein
MNLSKSRHLIFRNREFIHYSKTTLNFKYNSHSFIVYFSIISTMLKCLDNYLLPLYIKIGIL